MITFSWLGVKVCMLVTVGKLAGIGSGMDKLPDTTLIVIYVL